MIARPKISQNEWKTAEIGAFEVGRVALSCRPEPDAPRDEEALAAARPAAALERGRDVARAVDAEPGGKRVRHSQLLSRPFPARFG